jgi:hypothetical protein
MIKIILGVEKYRGGDNSIGRSELFRMIVVSCGESG